MTVKEFQEEFLPLFWYHVGVELGHMVMPTTEIELTHYETIWKMLEDGPKTIADIADVASRVWVLFATGQDQRLPDYISKVQAISQAKSEEYSANNNKFHNFELASKITGKTPRECLLGMALKHYVSLIDIKEGRADKELLPEKMTDMLTYLAILAAMDYEEMEGEKKKCKQDIDVIAADILVCDQCGKTKKMPCNVGDKCDCGGAFRNPGIELRFNNAEYKEEHF